MGYLLKKSNLENLMGDNEDIYYRIDSNVDKIIDLLDYILSVDDYIDEYDTIYGNLDYSEDYFLEIQSSVSNAKDNGCINENQLYEGKNSIEQLQNEIEELKENIEQLEMENSNLELTILDIENKIETFNMENLASNNKRLRKLTAANYSYICHAHDAIYDISEKCSGICSKAKEYFELIKDVEYTDEVIDQYNDYFQDIIGDMKFDIDELLDALKQAERMNQRMGEGIEDKIKLIEELTREIDELNNDLEYKKISNQELENRVNELNDLLTDIL